MHISKSWKYVWINLGWYQGEPILAVKLSLFEPWATATEGKYKSGTVFEIQVAKFRIAFGWC